MPVPAFGYAPVYEGELLYQVEGEGPGLVLIHAGVAHLGMWDEQWPAFTAGHRCLRYDCRGFGGSRSRPVTFNNIKDLLDVMDHVGMGRAALVGCSRGGEIGLDAVLEHPDRFSAFVSVCGGVNGYNAYDGVEVPPAAMALVDEIEKVWKKRTPEEARQLWELEARLWADGPGQPENRLPPAVRARLMALNWVNIQRQSEGARAEEMPIPSALRMWDIRVPVLAISGRFDELFCQRSMAYLAREAPEGRLVEVDSAHLPNVEQPEWFTRTVLDFLAGVGA